MPFPRSAHDLTGGLNYFARMCDKIRLLAAGELPADYHNNIGKGMDARLCTYLEVSYDDVKAQILAGKTDEEALARVRETGRKLSDVDILVWNGFSVKRGWNDEASEFLAQAKVSSGLSARDDIQTLFHYFDVDEGRKE